MVVMKAVRDVDKCGEAERSSTYAIGNRLLPVPPSAMLETSADFDAFEIRDKPVQGLDERAGRP